MTSPLYLPSLHAYHRIYFKTKINVSIISCTFSNSLTSELRGGAISIEDSNYVELKNCIFVNCSATNFGGPFSIIADVCKVHKVCCNSCWITIQKSFNNGCAGFLTGNIEAYHTLSSIYDCAPEYINNPGFCIFAFHNCDKAIIKDVNASHCKHVGYLLYQCDDSDVTYSTFDDLTEVCLYFSKVPNTNCQCCNMVRHTRNIRGALYGQSLPKKLIVKSGIFYDNVNDVFSDGGYGFLLSNCSTDKNSFTHDTIDCSTGIIIYSTFSISNANGCYIPVEVGKIVSDPRKKYMILFFFVSYIAS